MKRFIAFILLTSPIFSLSFAMADSSAHEISSQLDNSERAVWKISILEADESERSRVVMNGTGFFVGANRVITNFHVISPMLGRPENDIVLSQGENTAFVKRVLALSAVYDLALLEVERGPIYPLILKEEVPVFEREEEDANFLSLREDPPRPDEDLFITAYPGGVFTRIRKTGDISYEDSQHYGFSVSKSGLHGTSGSPVLDKQGQVVGVVFGGLNNFLDVIRVNYLREFIAGDTGIKCPNFSFNKVVGFAVAEACIKEEIENLKELAEEDSTHAQFKLALMYFKGVGVNQDLTQTFQWVKRSSDQSYALAQYYLALMYFNSLGVDLDLNQAFQWIERSAEQGYAPAQDKLALMSSEGEDIVMVIPDLLPSKRPLIILDWTRKPLLSPFEEEIEKIKIK